MVNNFAVDVNRKVQKKKRKKMKKIWWFVK